MNPGSRRAIIAALLANASIAVAKFVGYGITGAASLLAEAVHSVADTGNQALLLWGGAAARRAPSEQHPFGYGRERYFWAFVVSLVLFALGSLFAIYAGVQKLLSPHAVTDPTVAVGIILMAIVLEGLSFRTALTEARPLKGDASWWAFIRHTRNPELPVVVLEDFGALCGLLIALAGVGLTALTGNPRFDAIGSVTIGVLLGVISVVLSIEMRSLLLGEAATPLDLERIREAVLAQEGVRTIIHMRTQHIGPEELLVGAKVEFDGRLAAHQIADAIDEVEAAVREAVAPSVIIYIEPDFYEASQDESLQDGPGAAGTGDRDRTQC
jgi:cation diffusion facilitator family transporter